MQRKVAEDEKLAQQQKRLSIDARTAASMSNKLKLEEEKAKAVKKIYRLMFVERIEKGGHSEENGRGQETKGDTTLFVDFILTDLAIDSKTGLDFLFSDRICERALLQILLRDTHRF